jgi:hypothetical protein
VVVGNQHRYPIGHQGGLQGGAVLAQISGAEAAWSNPAGLVMDGGLPASASANLYSFDMFRVSGGQASYSNWEAQVIPSAIAGSFAVPLLDSATWRGAVFLTQPQLWSNEVVFHHIEVYPGQYSQALSESSGRVESLCPGVALGCRLSPRWRVGLQVHVSYFSYREQVTATNRSWGGPGGFVLNSRNRVDRFGFYHLVGACGVQGELGDGWRTALMARAPGIQVWQFGRLDASRLDETAQVMSSSISFDDRPTLDYRLPAEISLGIARIAAGWGLESDLIIRPSAGSYHVATSDRPAVVTVTERATGATQLALGPPRTVSTSATAGLGASMGGWVRLRDHLVGHLGWWYDPSPVSGSGDDLFSPVSLYGTSLGASYVKEDFALSLGLLGSYGVARDVKVFTGGTNPTGSTLEVLGLGATVSTSMKL